MTLTLHKSQDHYAGVMQGSHAVMSLQFTQVCSFSCGGRGCETGKRIFIVGLYYVTITWQQILKASLQMIVEGVLPHMTVESRRLDR